MSRYQQLIIFEKEGSHFSFQKILYTAPGRMPWLDSIMGGFRLLMVQGDDAGK